MGMRKWIGECVDWGEVGKPGRGRYRTGPRQDRRILGFIERNVDRTGLDRVSG